MTSDVSEQKNLQSLIAGVALTCDELTDQELAALNMVVQSDWNPRGRLFDYEKVKSLFTEAEGMQMHGKTKVALTVVVNDRLQS